MSHDMTDKEVMDALRDIDKRTADFSLRIPEITKLKIDQLPLAYKRRLNDCILLTMDRILHDADYIPGKHLKTEEG